MSFNFPPLFAEWRADEWQEQLEKALGLFDPIGAWPRPHEEALRG